MCWLTRLGRQADDENGDRFLTCDEDQITFSIQFLRAIIRMFSPAPAACARAKTGNKSRSLI